MWGRRGRPPPGRGLGAVVSGVLLHGAPSGLGLERLGAGGGEQRWVCAEGRPRDGGWELCLRGSRDMELHRLAWVVSVGLIIVLVAGCGAAAPVATSVPSPTSTFSPSHTPTRPSGPMPTSTTSPTSTVPPSLTPTLPHSQTPTPLPLTAASPLGPWEPLPTDGLPGPWVGDVAFGTPEVVFLVAGGDVYRSTDGGVTWEGTLSIYRAIQSVAVSPGFAADRTVFALDGGSRLFRSVDDGESWEQVARIDEIGGASDEVVWLSISPAYVADATLWATCVGAAYRSTDGGLTWAPFDPGFEISRETRLVPNPDYPDDPTLGVLDYGAAEWAPVPDGLLCRPTALATSGATRFLGTACGLHRSTDDGATWREANAGLPAASVSLAAAGPDGTVFAATSVDPRLFYLPAGAARWEPVGPLPEGSFGAARPRRMDVRVGPDAAPMLVMTTFDGVFVSCDGGASWTLMEGAGLPALDFSDPPPLLSSDFAADGVAHLALRETVYRTDDGGASWAAVAGVSGAARLVETPHQRLIALARRAIYEWDPGGGAAWNRYPADFGFKTSTELDQAAARFVTDQLGVVIAGGDVYVSEDGGRSWTLVGQSEFGQLAYHISPRFDRDRAIYAQDDVAIMVSTDAGETWVEAGEGLPPCEYDSPECGLALLDAQRYGDGYRVYALVRQDFRSRLYRASAEEGLFGNE